MMGIKYLFFILLSTLIVFSSASVLVDESSNPAGLRSSITSSGGSNANVVIIGDSSIGSGVGDALKTKITSIGKISVYYGWVGSGAGHWLDQGVKKNNQQILDYIISQNPSYDTVIFSLGTNAQMSDYQNLINKMVSGGKKCFWIGPWGVKSRATSPQRTQVNNNHNLLRNMNKCTYFRQEFNSPGDYRDHIHLNPAKFSEYVDLAWSNGLGTLITGSSSLSFTSSSSKDCCESTDRAWLDVASRINSVHLNDVWSKITGSWEWVPFTRAYPQSSTVSSSRPGPNPGANTITLVTPESSGNAALHRLLSSIINNYQSDILDAAQLTGLDPKVIIAIIAVESGGNPSAVSGTGVKGLMQVAISTFNQIYDSNNLANSNVVKNRGNPRSSIIVGSLYFKSLYDKPNIFNLPSNNQLRELVSLLAYNVGPAVYTGTGCMADMFMKSTGDKNTESFFDYQISNFRTIVSDGQCGHGSYSSKMDQLGRKINAHKASYGSKFLEILREFQFSYGGSSGNINEVTELVFPIEQGKIGNLRNSFGNARDGGNRCHFGIDIYEKTANSNPKILAIADGTVTHNTFKFHSCSGGDAMATLIYHPSLGKTVLYGEMYGGSTLNRKNAGDTVTKGEVLGTIGPCKTGGKSMLHIEFWEGNKRGNSSVTSADFRRRWQITGSDRNLPKVCTSPENIGTKPVGLVDPYPILNQIKSSGTLLVSSSHSSSSSGSLSSPPTTDPPVESPAGTSSLSVNPFFIESPVLTPTPDLGPYTLNNEFTSGNSETGKIITLMDRLSFTAKVTLFQSDNNGPGDRGGNGRSTLIFQPNYFDKNQPAEIIYYFHGLNGFGSWDLESRIKPQFDTIAGTGRNFVLVVPELPWSSIDFNSKNSGTRRQGGVSPSESSFRYFNFLSLHNEILNKIGNPGNYFTTVVGHSKGGLMLEYISTQDGQYAATNTKKIVNSDGDYSWTGRSPSSIKIYENYVMDHSDVEYTMVVQNINGPVSGSISGKGSTTNLPTYSSARLMQYIDSSATARWVLKRCTVLSDDCSHTPSGTFIYSRTPGVTPNTPYTLNSAPNVHLIRTTTPYSGHKNIGDNTLKYTRGGFL